MERTDAREPITFIFGMATIRVWPEARYLETRFSDETSVPAAPEDTDDYRERARFLGYGEDTWAMCLEHEVAHSLIAMSHGRVVSPTLWAVAHGTADLDRGIIAAEEAEVLLFQKKLNQCRGRI